MDCMGYGAPLLSGTSEEKRLVLPRNRWASPRSRRRHLQPVGDAYVDCSLRIVIVQVSLFNFGGGLELGRGLFCFMFIGLIASAIGRKACHFAVLRFDCGLCLEK